LSSCLLAVDEGSGINIAGFPSKASSVKVSAPLLATT